MPHLLLSKPKCTLVKPSLVGLYKFLDGTGQTLTDSAGTNNGTLGSTAGSDTNDPTWLAYNGVISSTFTRDSEAYGPNGEFYEGNSTNLLTANQSSLNGTDTTGFDLFSSTISRDTSTAYRLVGTAALKCITSNLTANEGATTNVSASLTNGVPYTASVWLCGSGTVQIGIREANVATTYSGTITLTATPTRYSVTRTWTSTNQGFVRVQTNVQQNTTFYVSGLQLEAKSYATSWTLGGTSHGGAPRYYPVEHSSSLTHPTFTRNSPATLNGATYTANTPRFTGAGLFIEEATTNLLYGLTWEQGAYDLANGNTIASTTRLRPTTKIAVSASTSYTLKCNNTVYNNRLIIYYTSGDVFISSADIGGQQSSTVTTPVGCGKIGVCIKRADAADIVAGEAATALVQLEQKAYATSYQDSTAARVADSFYLPSAGVITAEQGTVEMLCNFTDNSFVAGFRYLLYIKSGNSSIFIYQNSGTGKWSMYTANANGDYTIKGLSVNPSVGTHRVTIKWSAAKIAFIIDGTVYETPNPYLPEAIPTNIYIGTNSSNVGSFNGFIKDVHFYAIALDDVTLAYRGSTSALPVLPSCTYHLPLVSNTDPDYPGTMGLMVEEATTNLLTANQSKLITDLTGIHPNLTTETVTRDTGSAYRIVGNGAIKVITPGGSSGEGFYGDYAAVTSGAVTFSVWLCGTGTVVVVVSEYQDTTYIGESASGVITLTNVPTRYSFTRTFAAGSNRCFPVVITNTSEVITFYASGLQVEQKAYATSWIDGASTRAATVVTCPTAGVLSPSEGTIEMLLKPMANTLEASATHQMLWTSIGVTSAKRISLGHNEAGQWYMKTGNVDGTVTSIATATGGTVDTPMRLTCKWASTEMSLSINGVKGTPTATPTLPPSLDSLIYIGSSGGTNNFLNGVIADVHIHSTALSDAVLTTRGSTQPLPMLSSETAWLPLVSNLNGTASIPQGMAFMGDDYTSQAATNKDMKTAFFVFHSGLITTSSPVSNLINCSPGGVCLGAATVTLTNEIITVLNTDGAAKTMRWGWCDASGSITSGWHLVEIRWMGTAYEIFLDGVSKPVTEYKEAGVAVAPINLLAFNIGRNVAGNGYFVGNMYYIINYESALTDSQLKQTRRYLKAEMAKRGIALNV